MALARGAGAGDELQWPSVPGQAYSVQYSSDLMQWFVLTNVVAAGLAESLLLEPPPPGVQARYYRLR